MVRWTVQKKVRRGWMVLLAGLPDRAAAEAERDALVRRVAGLLRVRPELCY